MALSLDDVINDIYKSYKITEDEQIEQGILKKRVHPDDFSAPLRDQLKNLNDEELLAVSDILKDKLHNYISYDQNGIVNIAIPQSIIEQGKSNAEFRRRSVSGISLENKPITETIIETAGTIALADYVQQYIKPEDLIDSGLFGGMDYEIAVAMAHDANVQEEFFTDGNTQPNEAVFKLFYNRLPYKNYIDPEIFDGLANEKKIRFLAHPSAFYNALSILKNGSPEYIARAYALLRKHGIDEKLLLEMGLTQEKLMQMANDPRIQEEYKKRLEEKEKFLDNPRVKASFHKSLSDYIKDNFSISEEELSALLNSREMRQIMLDSFEIDDNGELVISNDLSGYLTRRYVKRELEKNKDDGNRKNSIDPSEAGKYDDYNSNKDYYNNAKAPSFNKSELQGELDESRMQSQFFNNPKLSEYLKSSDFVSNHKSNDLVSRQLVALKILQSRSDLSTRSIDEFQKVTDMKKSILEKKPVKEKFSEEIATYIKAKYPSISPEQLETFMNSQELHTIQMDSFEIIEDGQVLVSDIIIRQLADRFLSEGPVLIDALQTDRVPIDVTSITETIAEYAYGLRDYFSYLQHDKEPKTVEDVTVTPQEPRSKEDEASMFEISVGDGFLSGSYFKLSGIDTAELDEPKQSIEDTVSQGDSTPTEPEILDKDAEPPLTEKAEELIVDRSFEEKSISKEAEPDLADDTIAPSTESFENTQEDDNSSTASSDSSATSSNNTGMIKSGNKSAATVGGFWSNFMRHMREDKGSKGLIGRIRSAYRKAREDRDKELGFAKDEPTEVSNSESPLEEPTFDDRYRVDMSGKSTPIAPQPEKTTTDTKSRDPEEPTQGPDDPTL